ncbi:MAG: peptidyl-prolyl cis-trans isomerase [Geminicoccaceae bacterium]|nr:peptidyl-prolyl cis-trans isomerase [Geminicoccaceae bacterium]
MVRVLLGLLIVSFAIWGVGDIFLGPRGGEVVAEVGDLEVTSAELGREFEDQITRLRQQFDTPIDRPQALALGLLDQSLQQQVAQRLVDMHGRELGLGVADATVRARVTEDPLFRGEGGFDRQRLELVLRSQGQSEAAFVDEIRDEVRRALLVDAVSGITAAPEALARALYAYRNEKRRAELLRVDASSIEVEQPDEATLQAYLEENQAQYEAPEYRSGVLVALRPADIEDEITIDEESLREEYAAREQIYTIAEKRKVGQLLASDKEVIERAAEAIEEGSTLAEVAESMSADGVAYSSIGPLGARDLPAALADPIFALEPGQLSAPVQSPFGWHLFRLIDVEPENVTPFEEVRDALHADLAHRRAVAELPDLATALDDEIAAGSTIEDAARTLDLEPITLDKVDRRGLDEAGQPVEGVSAPILAQFFTGREGEPSLMEQTDDGYFVYRVDSIEAPRARTLDEVRDEVAAAWIAEQRTQTAMEKAEALLARAREGMTPAALVAEDPATLELETTEPIVRGARGNPAGLSPEAVDALFATPEGAFADRPFATAGGAVVLRTAEVIEAGTEGADATAIDGLRTSMAREMRGDLLLQYEQALRRRFPVEIDEGALRALANSMEPRS